MYYVKCGVTVNTYPLPIWADVSYLTSPKELYAYERMSV